MTHHPRKLSEILAEQIYLSREEKLTHQSSRKLSELLREKRIRNEERAKFEAAQKAKSARWAAMTEDQLREMFRNAERKCDQSQRDKRLKYSTRDARIAEAEKTRNEALNELARRRNEQKDSIFAEYLASNKLVPLIRPARH